jgi:hypothetical protein
MSRVCARAWPVFTKYRVRPSRVNVAWIASSAETTPWANTCAPGGAHGPGAPIASEPGDEARGALDEHAVASAISHPVQTIRSVMSIRGIAGGDDTKR